MKAFVDTEYGGLPTEFAQVVGQKPSAVNAGQSAGWEVRRNDCDPFQGILSPAKGFHRKNP